LFELAGAQHRDAVGERHGLDLIVGHVHDGGAEALVQLLDLHAHLATQLRVEIRQRLVEEEHLRPAHDGAAHGDALTLAAGELARACAPADGRSGERRRLP
jgi:hypothetical protein